MTDVGFYKIAQPRDQALLFRVYHLLTPETDRTTHYFWVMSRNFSPVDEPMDEYIRTAVAHTFDEDRTVLELQQRGLDEAPPGTPFPGVAFVIDGAPVRARRVLEDLVERERQTSRPIARPALV
jgi:phenylpropionate dioxygenase-like ring-hydroxylating dioxygenase large terminal subunit